MSSKKLNPFKDFQSDQIQRSSRKIFTAHYASRNTALNLTPVTGTTKGFIFQIMNSLIESWGVCLTWFDCKARPTAGHWGICPGGGEGGTWVNFCWACGAGLSEPLPHYSLFCDSNYRPHLSHFWANT